MIECTTITVNSPAKINLTFEVLGLLPDGYHEVRTLMQAVSLFDQLQFDFTPTREPSLNISLAASSGAAGKSSAGESGEFPLGESNLIARAMRLFLSSLDRPRALKVNVVVSKNVPIGAGLAGGSGNAAAALVALNQYFGGPLGQEQLIALASRLGADVPFCLSGGRQLGLGKGDSLEAVDKGDDNETLHFVLAKTRHLSLATPWVYQSWDEKSAQGDVLSLAEKVKDRGIDSLPSTYAIDNLRQGNLKEALRAFGNDFEQIVLPNYKQLKEIKQRFLAAGALSAQMTGSGPTMFALAESAEHAQSLIKEFRQREADDHNLVCATKFDQIDLYPVHSINQGSHVVQVEKS